MQNQNSNVRSVSRRQLFQSAALAGGFGATAEGEESGVTLDVLRSVAAANGAGLSDDRLRVLQPVLERRVPQLRALRNFQVDDAVEPTQGILDK